MLLAFLRSPFYDRVTGVPVEKVSELWRRIPGLCYLNVVELMLLWRPYYFTSSGT